MWKNFRRKRDAGRGVLCMISFPTISGPKMPVIVEDEVIEMSEECLLQNEYFESPAMRVALLEQYANRYGDLKVATYFGDDQWSKHRTVIECNERNQRKWLADAGHRQIFLCEIVIDIDQNKGESLHDLQQRSLRIIKNLALRFQIRAYFSGSKGYHIHIILPELILRSLEYQKQKKKELISECQADMHKASASSLIAMEFAPHWKTGKQKTLIFDNTGRSLVNELYR